MLDCTTERYDLLYARWLERPGDLLDLAGWVPGMRLLDLCGGTGAVTREALRRGANPKSLTLLDLNPRFSDSRVNLVTGAAERLGTLIRDWETFDVVVCRQAISYLSVDKRFAAFVWTLLRPGGKFTFNSFVQPRWAFKSYAHGGHDYVELSAWFPVPFSVPRVAHVQWCKGAGADISLFRWHREADLKRVFESMFAVEITRSERGLRWVCTRPTKP